MRTRTKALGTIAGGLLAAWVGWGLYVDRTTERVPFQTVEEFDGVEIRRYPRTLLVETTADDEETAFRRLFRYISGENAADEEVAMTAPVSTTATGAGTGSGTRPEDGTGIGDETGTAPGDGIGIGDETGLGTEISMTAPVRTVRDSGFGLSGEKVSMTAPVRTTPDSDASSVTMAFYLPAEYEPGTAPTPTDPRVRLVVEPSQTLAVREFSWYATDDRVEKNLRKLRDALVARDLEPRGRPILLRYDDPWTPPFMRSSEVAVEVENWGEREQP